MSLFKRTPSEFFFRRFVLRHYASNLLVDMQLEAKKQSFEYIMQNMPDVAYFDKHEKLVANSLDLVTTQGLYLEFGVGRGKSMRWIAPRVKQTVHGFDSFDGIPEQWNGNPIGAFAQKKLPKVPKNVEFHVGLFGDTIPGFLEKHPEPIAFLHVDCDLYSSTCTIFEHLGPRLQPGAIVLFDEYFNYHRWQEHEFKGFQEFVERSGVRYQYTGFSVVGSQVAVRIEENPLFKQ